MYSSEANGSVRAWVVWLCVVGSALPGGRAEAEDPAAPVPKPATLAEVRGAIDWLKFPKPDGAIWEKTDLLNTHYWVPGTTAEAADSYRKIFAAQGWGEVKKTNADPEPDKFQSLEFTKSGFLVSVNLQGKNKHAEVNLNHLGNVDARRLPKAADAKAMPAHSSYVTYTTASKPETAAEFCRKELAPLGWRETPTREAKFAAKEGKTILRFVQNAVECKVSIAGKKDGETEVVYHTFFRSTFDPAEIAAAFVAREVPKPATVDEALRVLDLRKLPRLGESAPKVNTGLRTEYETRANVAKTVAFYRKALTDQGWALVPPLTDEDATGDLHFEKAGYRVSVRIENLIDQPKKTGLVGIAITNHGNVDERQLPYMPGAEVAYGFPDRYTAPATAEAAAEFYRKELAQRGWQEKKAKGPARKDPTGYHLEFFQNDARLKVYVHATRDGQTPIQMSATFGGER